MKFRDALRREREAKGLSLRDLQEATGLHFASIGKIERGLIRDPKFRHVVKLAKALGMNLPNLWKYE